MLNLSTKEFDLNSLFSFETLKEILLELAKSQIKLENSIKILQKENKQKDKKIIALINYTKTNDDEQFDLDLKNAENIDINIDNMNKNEEIINELTNENNGMNKESENGNNNEQKIIQEKSETVYNENPQEKINIIDNNSIINQENNNNTQNFPSSNINTNININPTTESNLSENQIAPQSKPVTIKSQSQFQSQPDNIENNIYNISKPDNANKISPLLIKNMMKQIKDQKAQISKLEEKIKNIQKEETKITNITLENKSENNLFQKKLDELTKKNQDMEQNIETIQSELKGLDFINILQDDGSGNIDATKVLVKALQEKVFKKFELVEQRYKKDALENSKTKSTVDNLVPKIDLMKNELEKINEYNRKKKDEFDEYMKNNENIRNETKDNIYEDIKKNINTLKEEQNNKILNIDEKINDLNNITNKIIKDSENKLISELKQKEQAKQIELENLKNIDNKFQDLNKKISILDNTIKSHLKSPDIDNIKKDISEIKLSLNEKATNDALKEMHNNILKNYNDINDIKDNLFNIDEEVQKMRKEVRTCLQKVESFQGNLFSMQNTLPTSNTQNKIIDYSKYFDQNKIKEIINPILKEIDTLTREIYSVRRDMTEGDTMTKNSIKKLINKLDEEYKNLFKDLKIFVHKKFLEKNEYNKTMRKLEVQIKYLTDEKKKDAESWLLGKKNICFNCASCEKNINNENYTTADYLAWKKYPKGEKIHRMGQGFSHMLEMMSEDFAKNIEKNDLNLISENNNNTYANTLPSKERANSMRINRNKKGEASFKNIKFRKNLLNNAAKLPKMFSFKKYDIDGNHISDEENRNFDEKDNIDNIELNPRILKIMRKGIKNELNSFDNFKTLQYEKDNENK